MAMLLVTTTLVSNVARPADLLPLPLTPLPRPASPTPHHCSCAPPACTLPCHRPKPPLPCNHCTTIAPPPRIHYHTPICHTADPCHFPSLRLTAPTHPWPPQCRPSWLLRATAALWPPCALALARHHATLLPNIFYFLIFFYIY